MINWQVDEHVDVHIGSNVRGNEILLPGKITRVVLERPDGNCYKVVFDDPLVYGGQGFGWFRWDRMSRPGQRLETKIG